MDQPQSRFEGGRCLNGLSRYSHRSCLVWSKYMVIDHHRGRCERRFVMAPAVALARPTSLGKHSNAALFLHSKRTPSSFSDRPTEDVAGVTNDFDSCYCIYNDLYTLQHITERPHTVHQSPWRQVEEPRCKVRSEDSALEGKLPIDERVSLLIC